MTLDSNELMEAYMDACADYERLQDENDLLRDENAELHYKNDELVAEIRRLKLALRLRDKKFQNRLNNLLIVS